MEVHQLKERASQLACPGRQGVVSIVEKMINTIAFMAKRSTDVLARKSSEQIIEIVPGRSPMKNRLAYALVSMLIFLPAIVTGQSSDSPAPEGAAAPAAITGSAQRAYLDPATGRLLREPPPGAPVMVLGPEVLNMLSTSDAGLVERALPDGGYMVDLQGRFRHMAVATVADDGTIVIQEVAGEVFLPAGPELSEKSEKDEQ